MEEILQMLRLLWLDNIGSLEKGIEFANRFHWGLSVVEGGDQWAVFSGDQAIFATDSREALDAFLYGMGLAYSVLPDHIAEQFRRELDTE